MGTVKEKADIIPGCSFLVEEHSLDRIFVPEEFTEDEQRAVRKLLADLMLCTPDDLPTNVEDRIAGFDPLTFDLEGATKDFEADPPMAKRRLLELVGKMVDADGVIHEVLETLRPELEEASITRETDLSANVMPWSGFFGCSSLTRDSSGGPASAGRGTGRA